MNTSISLSLLACVCLVMAGSAFAAGGEAEASDSHELIGHWTFDELVGYSRIPRRAGSTHTLKAVYRS